MPRRCSTGAPRPRAPTWSSCPELQLTGYPPEDLVLKPEFVRRTMEAGRAAGRRHRRRRPGAAVRLDPRTRAARSTTRCILAEGGKLVARTLKHELPNYGTFDEKRVFAPGPLPDPIEWRGVKLGVPICEDIWLEAVCAASRQGGRGDAARPQRQPVSRSTRTTCASAGPPAGDRNRLAAGLSQPRRRAGRTGVRRLQLRRQRRRRDRRCRCPTGKRRCA